MRSKLLLVIFFFISIASFILLYRIHDTTEKEVVERFQTRQLLLTKQLAREIETSLRNNTQTINKLSSLIPLKNSNVNLIAAAVQEYFDYLKKDQIRSISVLDKNGTIIYSTEKNEEALKYSGRRLIEWVTRLENKLKPLITTELPVGISKPDNNKTFRVLIAAPIYGKNNTGGGIPANAKKESQEDNINGVVVFVSDLENIIESFFKVDSAITTKESVWVMDGDGTLLYNPAHPEMVRNNIHHLDKTCYNCHYSFRYEETILSNSSGTTGYKIKDHPLKLSSFSTIYSDNITWKLAINIPLDEVSNFINVNLNQTLILFGIIVITLLGSSYFISHSNRLKIIAFEETKHWKEKHELEVKLGESENQYRTIVENSPNPIFIHSEGKIVFVNQAAIISYGVKQASDLLGKSIFDLVHPDDREGVKKRVMEMLVTGLPGSVLEERFYTNDMQIVLAEVTPIPIVYQNKTAILVIVKDITERKKLELEHQTMYEITLGVTSTSNLNDLLKLIHLSMKKVIYADNFFVALYDPNTELFNFPYFVDKFDSAPEPTAMRKSCTAYVFRTGKPLLLTPELFQHLKEKNEVELIGSPSPSWIGIPLKTPNRTIGVLVLQHYEDNNAYSENDVKFLSTVGNEVAVVIERKLAEEELRKSEIKLNVILESTADGILAVDSEGRIIKTNMRFAELWSIPQEIIDSGDDNILLKYVKEQLTNPDEFISKIQRLHNSTEEDLDQLKFKNGRVFERFSAPLEMPDGTIGRVWSFRDITERIRAEQEIKKRSEELVKINAEKDKFFSIIAHDLKSPFNGFIGLTELMATSDEEYSKAELLQFNKALNNSATNLYKLIENLLEWAQMQRGMISFTPQKQNISEMVFQNIILINEKALQKGITIIDEMPSGESVTADGKMLDAILRNLLSNAVKFTKRDGRVIIKSKRTGDGTLEICVKDTGVGISEKDIKNLFKVEEKVSSPGTEGESSSGLGLLLCKEFVEKHSGRIWVESKENVGSTFFFTLPEG